MTTPTKAPADGKPTVLGSSPRLSDQVVPSDRIVPGGVDKDGQLVMFDSMLSVSVDEGPKGQRMDKIEKSIGRSHG